MFAIGVSARLVSIDAVKGAENAERHRDPAPEWLRRRPGQRRVIDPEIFEQLVARITGDAPLPDAALAALLDDPEAYACACELDAIWHLTGTLEPPPSPDRPA